MRALAHKSIVRCFGIYSRYEPDYDPKNITCYIVMEQMDENLKQYLVNYQDTAKISTKK